MLHSLCCRGGVCTGLFVCCPLVRRLSLAGLHRGGLRVPLWCFPGIPEALQGRKMPHPCIEVVQALLPGPWAWARKGPHGIFQHAEGAQVGTVCPSGLAMGCRALSILGVTAKQTQAMGVLGLRLEKICSLAYVAGYSVFTMRPPLGWNLGVAMRNHSREQPGGKATKLSHWKCGQDLGLKIPLVCQVTPPSLQLPA